ncbi:MAG: SUMF1/EgtB/PvdO family nonheme iron enzyme [Polyangiaceae bacterium]|nr:SUMF1/EgtB/PvdO family nonheme iron enzyme [Polyangiaceae bacterium]
MSLLLVVASVACGPDEATDEEATAAQSAAPSEGAPEGVAPPLPTGGLPSVVMPPPPPPPPPPKPRCPEDMVLVWDTQSTDLHYCVDRYEAMVVDDTTRQNLSPYYPPDPAKAAFIEKIWNDLRGSGTELEQATPLPPLPAWQKQKSLKPRAVSKKGVVPQAYASGKDAALVCGNAGKRLCSLHEWRTACRGADNRDFPYGTAYQNAVCNVVRETHPGILLWDNPSINHTDPRFNLLTSKTGPLLRRTGATVKCASVWGDDAIFDMVGNVDEWIDDPEGTFVGAFYARGRKDGCQAKVENHPFAYADYSTGIRCCKDATLASAAPITP